MAWGRGMLFLWTLWLLVAIGVAWAIVRQTRASRTRDPIDVIKRRYARGEIDAPTYHRMLDELHHTDHTGVPL